MDELPIHVSVGYLSAWEDEQVQRAYAFTVRQVRALLASDAVGEEVRSAEEEAAMFGEELLRRRLI